MTERPEYPRNPETRSVPQELVNRYWAFRHPDFRSTETDGHVAEELFFAVAETNGLRREGFRGTGVWDSRRYYPDPNDGARYVDLELDPDAMERDGERYDSPVVRIRVRTRGASRPEDAGFLDATREFRADQAFIERLGRERDARLAEQEAASDRHFAETVRLGRAMSERLVDKGWTVAASVPEAAAFATHHLGEEADLTKIAVRVLASSDGNGRDYAWRVSLGEPPADRPDAPTEEWETIDEIEIEFPKI